MDKETDDKFDLGRARFVKGRVPNFHLPLAERLRAARGMRQAVVKVTGFGRGTRGVMKALAYISRKGTLPLEKDSGELIQGLEEQQELVREWSVDFDGKDNSRDSAQVVLSMPPGSSVEALRKAVRNTGAKAFPKNEWVFGIHEDRQHPHAHMAVKMRDKETGKKLQLRKADLFQLRTLFAEAAREQGVMLAASPRWARGVGRKAVQSPLYHMRKRGIKPDVERMAVQETAKEFKARATSSKPWERAMADRNKSERKAYLDSARALRGKAATVSDEIQKKKLLAASSDLEKFGRTMPEPKTRRQRWMEKLFEKFKVQQPKKDLDRDNERGR